MNSDVREWFNEGFQKGRKEREAEIIEIIKKEGLYWEVENKILKQIKEQKNNDNCMVTSKCGMF